MTVTYNAPYNYHFPDPITIFTADVDQELLYPNSRRCQQLKVHYKSIFRDMIKVPGLKHGMAQIAPLLDIEEHQTDFIRINDDLTARLVSCICVSLNIFLLFLKDYDF